MRRASVIVLALLTTAVLLVGRDRPVPAAGPEPTREALAARVAALESLIPDQAHIMADVGAHFTNLWFAGRAENWPLADF